MDRIRLSGLMSLALLWGAMSRVGAGEAAVDVRTNVSPVNADVVTQAVDPIASLVVSGMVGKAWFVEAAKPGRVITFHEFANTGKEDLTDVPFTLGQVFIPGQLPSGMVVSARGPSGEVVPLQVDSKATHRDGSLRHAVLTFRIPKLAAGATSKVELLAAESGKAAAGGLKLEELAGTGYDVVVRLTLGSNGLYMASAKEALAAALKTNRLETWLSGPLATEWCVSMPVKKEDGTSHPHLSVRFDIRAYAELKNVRTDVCIENCWAYEPNPSGFKYDVSVDDGTNTVYERKGVEHSHHARWHRQFWTGGAPAVSVKSDREYLMATRVVPNYDRRIQVEEKAIAALNQDAEPMACGGLTSGMPNTGAHSDIGPIPHFAAVYVMTMDPRARQSTLVNGGCGGSFHIHYRDRNTDLPLSIEDYPSCTIRGDRSINPKTKKSEWFPKVENGMQKHIPDSAHQPSIAFVPYLISGDKFQLDELLFWADWNLVAMNCGYRSYEKGLLGYEQIRGIAWNMRTMVQAAYITPDAHPMKRYFVEKLTNNIAMFNKEFPMDVECKGKATKLGAFNWSGWDGFGRPWMDDFVTWTFGYIVDLGYYEANPMFMYKCKFVVGRMTPPFHWQHASMYTSKPKGADGKFFSTFADYYKANFNDTPSTPVMDGYPAGPYGYGANMQPALAIAVDGGFPGAKEAWDRYETRNPKQWYNGAPLWAVVPRCTTDGAVKPAR